MEWMVDTGLPGSWLNIVLGHSAPIAYIMNLRCSTSELLSAFKMSKVIPVYKGRDKSFMNNYRPISLITILDIMCYYVI